MSALPYDSRIEYIENTNAQYINTGYKPNQDTRIIATMKCVTSTNYGRMFGAGKCNVVGGYMMDYETGATGNLLVKYGSTKAWTKTTVKGDYNVHTYDYNKNVVYRDNVKVSEGTYTSFQSTSNLAIFTYLNGTSIGSSTELFKGRCYAFSIYENDVLVRDYIPVRVGQVGYLYDKVSGELFGNSGSGNFVLGNDITYSDGTVSTFRRRIILANLLIGNAS